MIFSIAGLVNAIRCFKLIQHHKVTTTLTRLNFQAPESLSDRAYSEEL